VGVGGWVVGACDMCAAHIICTNYTTMSAFIRHSLDSGETLVLPIQYQCHHWYYMMIRRSCNVHHAHFATFKSLAKCTVQMFTTINCPHQSSRQ
jgi:hypothetical protein